MTLKLVEGRPISGKLFPVSKGGCVSNAEPRLDIPLDSRHDALMRTFCLNRRYALNPTAR